MGLFNPPPKKDWTVLPVGQALTKEELQAVSLELSQKTEARVAQTARFLPKTSAVDTEIIRGIIR
jgi:hypothetical protein